MKCRISVALCTFNGALCIREQLLSIAGQTRPPDELVICDDASNDGTVELVEEFAQDAPFPVRLVCNPVRYGLPRNFEQAISLCQGDFIALSDQDDVWYANKIERLQSALLANPEAGYAFSDAVVVDENLHVISKSLWKVVGFDTRRRQQFGTGMIGQVAVLLRGNVVTGATMMIRTSLRDLAIPIPHDWIHDYWLALMGSSSGLFGVPVAEALVMYRQHSGQAIGARRSGAMQALRSLQKRSSRGASLARWQTAYRRLGDKDCNEVRALVGQKLTHEQQRAAIVQLPQTERLRCVWRELRTGEYYRFSRGLRSALKDLLTPR